MSWASSRRDVRRLTKTCMVRCGMRPDPRNRKHQRVRRASSPALTLKCEEQSIWVACFRRSHATQEIPGPTRRKHGAVPDVERRPHTFAVLIQGSLAWRGIGESMPPGAIELLRNDRRMRIAILSFGVGWHVRDLVRAAKQLGHEATPIDFRKIQASLPHASTL